MEVVKEELAPTRILIRVSNNPSKNKKTLSLGKISSIMMKMMLRVPHLPRATLTLLLLLVTWISQDLKLSSNKLWWLLLNRQSLLGDYQLLDSKLLMICFLLIVNLLLRVLHREHKILSLILMLPWSQLLINKKRKSMFLRIFTPIQSNQLKLWTLNNSNHQYNKPNKPPLNRLSNLLHWWPVEIWWVSVMELHLWWCNPIQWWWWLGLAVDQAWAGTLFWHQVGETWWEECPWWEWWMEWTCQWETWWVWTQWCNNNSNLLWVASVPPPLKWWQASSSNLLDKTCSKITLCNSNNSNNHSILTLTWEEPWTLWWCNSSRHNNSNQQEQVLEEVSLLNLLAATLNSSSGDQTITHSLIHSHTLVYVFIFKLCSMLLLQIKIFI